MCICVYECVCVFVSGWMFVGLWVRGRKRSLELIYLSTYSYNISSGGDGRVEEMHR